MDRLRLTEIFFSLQGETKTVGIPTVFVRLTGCPLRCRYCDTAYAFHGGTWFEVDEILGKVQTYQTRYVTVTGGEPLAQPSCLLLLNRLCDAGFLVSLETSGALPINQVDERVIKVLDIKTPDSGVFDKNHWDNIRYLLQHDQVKFVICSESDYIWAKSILSKYQLSDICQVLFSPSYHDLHPTKLAEWILRDQLPVRFQIQLHKFLWGDVPGK